MAVAGLAFDIPFINNMTVAGSPVVGSLRTMTKTFFPVLLDPLRSIRPKQQETSTGKRKPTATSTYHHYYTR